MVPWPARLVQFFPTPLWQRDHEFSLAGDATTSTKAGAQTHGGGLFFRAWWGKSSAGESFSFLRWWMEAHARPSPWQCRKRCAAQRKKQRSKRAKRRQQAKKTKSKLRGRPPGSRNKDKNELKLAGELVRINELWAALLQVIRVFVGVK